MSILNENILRLVKNLSSIPELCQDCIDSPTDENGDKVVAAIDECDSLLLQVKSDVVQLLANNDKTEEVEVIETDGCFKLKGIQDASEIR